MQKRSSCGALQVRLMFFLFIDLPCTVPNVPDERYIQAGRGPTGPEGARSPGDPKKDAPDTRGA